MPDEAAQLAELTFLVGVRGKPHTIFSDEDTARYEKILRDLVERSIAEEGWEKLIEVSEVRSHPGCLLVTVVIGAAGASELAMLGGAALAVYEIIAKYDSFCQGLNRIREQVSGAFRRQAGRSNGSSNSSKRNGVYATPYRSSIREKRKLERNARALEKMARDADQ